MLTEQAVALFSVPPWTECPYTANAASPAQPTQHRCIPHPSSTPAGQPGYGTLLTHTYLSNRRLVEVGQVEI